MKTLNGLLFILIFTNFYKISAQERLFLEKTIKFKNYIANIKSDKKSNKILIVEKDESIFPSKKSKIYYKTIEYDLTNSTSFVIDSSKVEMSSIAISNAFISTADYDGNIKVFNLPSYKLAKYHAGNGEWIYKHMFSQNSNDIYYINAYEKVAYKWNTITNKVDSLVVNKQINDFLLSDDLLIFGNFQKSEIWSEQLQKKILEIPFENVSNLSKSNDSYLIGLSSGILVVANNKFEIIKKIDTHFKSVLSIDANENFICSSSLDQSFAIYNTSTLELIHHELNCHRGRIDFALFTKDYLVTFGEDQNLKVWSIKN